jgi:LysR family hydrogen peroxide-inducible transcriptional activator
MIDGSGSLLASVGEVAIHPKARYPQLELDISEEQSQELVDQVRRGDLDTAILALPFPCEGLLSFRFWQEDFFWITHKDDALAAMDRISDVELDPASLMLLKEGHCLKDHALAACRMPGSVAHGLSATSLNTLVQLVACGMGTTLVPEMALSQLVDTNPDIARVPLAEPGPHREIAFILRPNYPSVHNIELMMELFRGELKSHFQVTEHHDQC